jgi:hypothetical protein
MSRTRLGFLSLAVLALVASACTPSASTPSPTAPIATDTAAPTLISQVSPTGGATATSTPAPTPSPTPAGPQKPAAPTNFTETYHKTSIPCPSPDSDSYCHMSDLAWHSSAATGTWFKIYESWTGEGGATCEDARTNESLVITTAPNARTAQLYDQMATGGGGHCLWITAVNNVGESAQVAVTGQV